MKNRTKLNKDCGKRLRECRVEAGMTQKELSETSHYSVQQICYIENGRRGMSTEAAKIFSKLLHVREQYLLGESNYKDGPDYLCKLSKDESVESTILNLLAIMDYSITVTQYKTLEQITPEIYGDTDVEAILEALKYLIITPERKALICESRDIENLIEEIKDFALFKLKRIIDKSLKLDIRNVHTFLDDEQYNDIVDYWGNLFE